MKIKFTFLRGFQPLKSLLTSNSNLTMASTSVSNGQDAPYVLYHNIWSICSIMVRYTLTVRGAPRNPAAAMMVEEQDVDINNRAQMEDRLSTRSKSQRTGEDSSANVYHLAFKTALRSKDN
jgi:hypothetical protein